MIDAAIAVKDARIIQNVVAEPSERNVSKADEATIMIAAISAASHNRPSKRETYDGLPLPYARNCRAAAEKKVAAPKPTVATIKGLGIADLR